MQKNQSAIKKPFFGQAWFKILISGLVLFFVVEKVLKATENPNFIPTVIVLGAFLVPVAFVTYVYGHRSNRAILTPVPAIAVCFLWGGVLGIVIAGLLE